MASMECGDRVDDVEWSGVVRVDPAAVVVVGSVAANAAELARWIARQREEETEERCMGAPAARRLDVVLAMTLCVISAVCVAVVSIRVG